MLATTPLDVRESAVDETQAVICQTYCNTAIRTRIDVANTDTVPDYLLTVMAAGYALARLSQRLKGVTAPFSASNRIVTTYYFCYDQSNGWFGAEPNLEARLKYVF